MSDISTEYLIKVRLEDQNVAAKFKQITTEATAAGEQLKQFTRFFDDANRVIRETETVMGRASRVTNVTYPDKENSQVWQRDITNYQAKLEQLKADLALQGKPGARTFDKTTTLQTPQGLQEATQRYQQFGDQVRMVSESVKLNGAQIKSVGIQYGEFNGRLVETGRASDDLTRNLDKQSSMFDHLRRRFQFIAEWMVFQQVLNVTGQALSSWMTEQRLMSDELANFDIITRGAASSVTTYNQAVGSISRATGIAPGEVAQGVLAQLRVPYAPQDAAMRGAEVQRVTGMDNVAAQRELIGLTIQTGLNSTQVLDRFAGAMRRSTLGAEELFGMLETAGPIAQQFNTSFDRVLGMIAGTSTVTGEAGNSIELLMRQLNRIYTDPRSKAMAEQITGQPVSQMVNGQEVRRDAYDILGEIAAAGPQAIQEFAETFPNVLGQKNQQLLIGMLKGWDNVRAAVESTEESVGLWGSSVERHMNTVGASVDNVTSAWQRLLRALGDAGLADTINALARFLDIAERLAVLGGQKTTPENLLERATTPLRMATPTWALAGELLRGKEGDINLAPSGESNRSFRDTEMAFKFAQERALAQLAENAWRVSSGTYLGGALPEKRVDVPGGVDVMDVRRIYEAMIKSEAAALGKRPGYTGYSQDELRGMVAPKESDEAFAFVTKFGEVLQITTGDVERYGLAVEKAATEVEKRGIDPETGQRIYGRPIALTAEEQQNMARKLQGAPAQEMAQAVIDSRVAAQARSFVTALGMSEAAALEMARGQQEWIPVLDESKQALFEVYGSAEDASIAMDTLTSATGRLAVSILSLPTVGGSRVQLGAYQTEFDAALARIRESGVLPDTGVEPTTTRFIDPATLKPYDVTATPDELELAKALVGDKFQYANEIAQAGNDYARESRDLLRSIASKTADMASSLLQPTEVTQEDVWNTKAGVYQDKWDEPVRRIRDVMERRKTMNPDLGPYAGLAGQYGIDLSSIESTMVTGQNWINRFYNGQLGPDFYEQNSKEGFLAAARAKMDEEAGRSQLQQQAVGWLTEAGISDEIAQQVAREMSGDISPLENMLLGGKTPEAVGKDIKAAVEPIGGKVASGLSDSIKNADMAKALELSFGLDTEKGQARLYDVGYSVGVWIVDGVSGSFKNKLMDAIVAAVYAMIEGELD